MKHRALFLAVFAVAGMFLLTACTDSGGEIAQKARSESSGNTDAGAADVGGADDAGVQPDASQAQDAGSPSDQDGSIQTVPDAGTADGSLQTDSGTQTELPPETSQTGNDGQSVTAEDIWSGTYVSEQETVTITYLDAKSFSFSFANSGIASTAEVDGYQAVYKGDDHHVVVFTIDGDILNITVSSEEDFDASGSPLNGTYIKQ